MCARFMENNWISLNHSQQKNFLEKCMIFWSVIFPTAFVHSQLFIYADSTEEEFQ